MIQSDESEKLSKVCSHTSIKECSAWRMQKMLSCAALREKKERIERITSHFFISMFAHIWMRKMEVTKSSNKYRPKEVGKPATWRTNLNAPSRQNRRIKARKIDFASNVHCTNSLPLFLLQECVFVSLLVFSQFEIRRVCQ